MFFLEFITRHGSASAKKNHSQNVPGDLMKGQLKPNRNII